MSETTDFLKQFHETRNFGSRENLKDQELRAAALYRDLSAEDVAIMAEWAIDSWSDEIDPTDAVLRCLACFQPGSLKPFHERLIDKGIFYPGIVYHGAEPEIAKKIIEGIADNEARNHMLLALSWIGDESVRKAFHDWRATPPAWADQLYVPPHAYAEEAGWEFTPNGGRQDLFRPECYPLVSPEQGSSDSNAVGVTTADDSNCSWCGRQLTCLLDVQQSAAAQYLPQMEEGRLRIVTCDVCTCYGTVFTNVAFDGTATWHTLNTRPDYLPDDSSDWGRHPVNPLVLADNRHPWQESVDWLLPGVSFSQIGGFPTWVQDAQFPRCVECDQSMFFVVQLDNEDIQDCGEGIYFMFLCRECGVAATRYQQS